MSEIALRCRGLKKQYEDLLAVDGIDLEIQRGECFGLLGPNGAGKTTTVEIFEGLREPTAGTVEVLGLSWKGHERQLRESLGIQLQESQFSDKLTVLETVRLFRSFYRAGLEAEQVIARVNLEEKANVWVRKLSGGQKQRLSLAIALVCEPQVLFLDEPTTGLDPQSRRKIWDIVTEFRSGGGTTLLTTHYMEEAERLCDRVAIIDRGKVIALGSPKQLIASLGADHVVEFETSAPMDDAQLRDIEGVEDVTRSEQSIRLRVSELHRTVPALLQTMDRLGADLNQLTTHNASLEDVFVFHTGRHLRDS